ncbi:DNA ligase 1-like isoform X2 [Temnothorax curvispinosus]|uniref:DNA ligase 1-like isoform X2 n=1 Tax=Temnothorax curvispinosus TaxID=300111 RepID=A0A6J1QN27_9HYME|nr:DNA ligase 1-like isoform X2 [Temnothorax curvispinosus]
MVQYFVVFFDEFCNLVPENWVKSNSKSVCWPPKKKKFTKQKMHLLEPDGEWQDYKYHKLLGPFETFEVANKVEEHCMQASTNEDTDETCSKALSGTMNKRVGRKPPHLESASEEEEEEKTSASEEEKEEKEKKEEEAKLNEANKGSKNNSNSVFEKELSYAQKQTKSKLPASGRMDCDLTCHVGAVTSSKAVKSVLKPPAQKYISTGEGSSVPMKKRRTDDQNSAATNVWESGDDTDTTQTNESCRTKTNESMDSTVSSENDRAHGLQRGERGPATTKRNTQSEPMTVGQFLKYYKQMESKLNHLISLQGHGRPLPQEEQNLLPEFPLENNRELEDFDANLSQSADVRSQFIRDIQLVGGANASKFTRAVLRHVMTDSLAKIYSWSGQRKTLKFSSTVICQLIIKTISKQTDATRTSIKEIIKSWLQHATDRMR